MLDGLEYLISNNPTERILKTVYAIKDEVIVSNSTLLVPIDPDVLDLAHLALFERVRSSENKRWGRDRDLNSGLGIHSPTGYQATPSRPCWEDVNTL